MKKNILIIPSTLLPIPAVKGGAVQNLINFFIDWNENEDKYNIVLFSIYDEKAAEMAKQYRNCKFQYVKFPANIEKKRNITNRIGNSVAYHTTEFIYLRAIRKYISTNNIDLTIFDNTPKYVLKLYKTIKSKILVHIYNDYINKELRYSEKVINLSSAVVTVSDYISNCVRAVKDDEKIMTLYNGVDIERFNMGQEPDSLLYKKYDINEKSVILLFVARLVPEKGIKELMEAYSLLNKKREMHLIVVGDKFYSGNTEDDFYKELMGIAAKCINKVSFVGYVPYSELDKFYSLADIGILPSMWDEPFSMAAIEYMASGLAVIVSDSGGFPEMIGNTGIIVKRNDDFRENLASAILQLVDNVELRRKYGMAARERSKMFSKENYCIGLDRIITKVI